VQSFIYRPDVLNHVVALVGFTDKSKLIKILHFIIQLSDSRNIRTYRMVQKIAQGLIYHNFSNASHQVAWFTPKCSDFFSRQSMTGL